MSKHRKSSNKNAPQGHNNKSAGDADKLINTELARDQILAKGALHGAGMGPVRVGDMTLIPEQPTQYHTIPIAQSPFAEQFLREQRRKKQPDHPPRGIPGQAGFDDATRPIPNHNRPWLDEPPRPHATLLISQIDPPPEEDPWAPRQPGEEHIPEHK